MSVVVAPEASIDVLVSVGAVVKSVSTVAMFAVELLLSSIASVVVEPETVEVNCDVSAIPVLTWLVTVSVVAVGRSVVAASMRVPVAIVSDLEDIPVVALVSSAVPITEGGSRPDVVAVLSDRDVKAASLERDNDVLADGTARAVVVVTSCRYVADVDRSRVEMSNSLSVNPERNSEHLF